MRNMTVQVLDVVNAATWGVLTELHRTSGKSGMLGSPERFDGSYWTERSELTGMIRSHLSDLMPELYEASVPSEDVQECRTKYELVVFTAVRAYSYRMAAMSATPDSPEETELVAKAHSYEDDLFADIAKLV